MAGQPCAKGDNVEITVTEENGKKLVELVGRLDPKTAPLLEAEAGKIYESELPDVIVDMAKCDFVSSAGLRVIVAMQKRAAAGASLVFRNVRDDVMDVFEMTGFTSILTFE